MSTNEPNTQREVELKFAPAREVQARLASSSNFEQIIRTLQGAFDLGDFNFKEEGQFHLIDEYYDTQNLSLCRDHASLRIRNCGHGSMELTLKTTRGQQSGIFDRKELTKPITAQQADDYRADGLRTLLNGELKEYHEHSKAGLKHVLTVTNERRVFSLVRREERFELSLDKFQFQKPGTTTTLPASFEIEIEAKNNAAVSSLPKIRASIEKIMSSLILATKSKYEQGVDELGLSHRTFHQIVKSFWNSPNFGTWLGVLVSAVGVILSIIIYWLQSVSPGEKPNGALGAERETHSDSSENSPAKK